MRSWPTEERSTTCLCELKFVVIAVSVPNAFLTETAHISVESP